MNVIDKRKVHVQHSSWGEYRVPSPDGSEAGAYYTDCREDAETTARILHGDVRVVFTKRDWE